MEKTIILATGKEIRAKIKEGEKWFTPAVMYRGKMGEYGEMGVVIFYDKDDGKRTGSFWGLLLPQLPIRCFRAMKILEQLNDFTDDSLLSKCWNSANRNPHKSEEEDVRKIKNLLGENKLASILNTPMTESEIDLLLLNLSQVDNGIEQHPFSEIKREMNAGFFPKTEIVKQYLKNELKPNPLSQVQDTKPSFEEVMEFNKNIWPRFREKFVNGEFTRQDAVNFLKM